MVNEIKVSYGRDRITLPNSPKILSSKDAHRVLRYIWEDDIDICERFYVLFLNRANIVKGYHMLSKGSIDGTLVDKRILFGIAVKTLSCSIILAHNHPSGNHRPSQRDIDLTKEIGEGARLLGINLLDHLILTPDKDKYLSMQDRGIASGAFIIK